jgi:pyruvate formate lyase activating enzyme
MDIGGIQKISLSDYPRRISAVVFTQGCDFRCPFCHNPQLVDPARFGPRLPEGEVLSFLERRRGKIDAVTVTGGEPTLQGDLPRFLTMVKEMGYLAKLDTNGARPDVLVRLLRDGLLDYVAMDVKGPLESYARLAGRPVATAAIAESIAMVMGAGIPYEFRTTVVKVLLSADELRAMGRLVPGACRWFLQQFVPAGLLDAGLAAAPQYTEEELAALVEELRAEVPGVALRR